MPEESQLAIRTILLPKDTNPLGTIFGGAILSHIDLAASVEARRQAPLRFVTRAMREVEFREPVYVGDLLSFYTETLSVGHSSVSVRVLVEAQRWRGDNTERVRVTEAEVVMVAVDENGRKRSILS